MIWIEKIIGVQNAKGYFKNYPGGATSDQGGNQSFRFVQGEKR